MVIFNARKTTELFSKLPDMWDPLVFYLPKGARHGEDTKKGLYIYIGMLLSAAKINIGRCGPKEDRYRDDDRKLTKENGAPRMKFPSFSDQYAERTREMQDGSSLAAVDTLPRLLNRTGEK